MADINIFAATDWRNQGKRFGIRREDRRLHMYVIGRTGMGKTSLLLNMALNDIRTGEGVCFIDPHGDAVQSLRDVVPSARLQDTVYFSPADAAKPMGLNILEDAAPESRHIVVSGVISIFAHLYGHNWQNRQEHILRNALFALLDQEEPHTLLSVYRLLVDARFRRQVTAGITDPMVKTFWQVEYPRYLFSKSDALSTLLNKLGGFLTVPLIRHIVAKKTSDIDFREFMDQRRILLVNLSKGRLGEDNAAFLGALVLLKLQLAAMSRANTPEHKRTDYYVCIDEAQSIVGVQGIDHLLSEARKYRLCLTLGHQYLGQLDDQMRQAIFGNVGTTVCFAVGPEDALTLEKQFDPPFSRQERVYRKRFERSSDIPRHRFQEGDLVLLKLVADYRFLDTDLLRILAGRGIRNLRRRLQWLYHAGYLDRPASQQDYPLTRGPMVYTLGRKGATLLSDPRIGYDTNKIDWYTRSRQAKLFFIEHTMMVSRIRATLTLATQAVDGIELADWQQGRHLNDRVWVEEYGEELPVAPDGAFSLRLTDDQRGYRHFLLEADRGTMSLQDRMRKKLRAYWRWFREGRHRDKLGIEAFRVLTITNSERRRDNLVELAKQVDDAQQRSHLFLFGYEGDFTLDLPEAILEEVFQSPADSTWHALIE